VIKNDIINAVAEAANVPRQKATQAVETIIDVLRQALSRGERIELRGFGVFLVKPRKRGIGRNPKRPTEEVQIPPGFTIRFKPGKELRDMTGPPDEPAPKAGAKADARAETKTEPKAVPSGTPPSGPHS
jgi:DNA-binding protein HU-beta